MNNRIIVYLDSQDFSRFGDVLRGKSDKNHEDIFKYLKYLKDSGDVIFPITMPLMCELLQYNPEYADTTRKKAEAIERLCGPYALPAPMRLIAIELAKDAQMRGKVVKNIPDNMLSSDRLWFPIFNDALSNLRQMMYDGALQNLQRELALLSIDNTAEEILDSVDWSDIINDISPLISDKLGIPEHIISTSIYPFINGEISSEEASINMLSGISHPQVFVDIYFERYGTLGKMPTWISDPSLIIAEQLNKLRDIFGPIKSSRDKKLARTLLSNVKSKFSEIVINLAKISGSEFGLHDNYIDEISQDLDRILTIPSSEIVVNLLESYTLQIIGVSANQAKIENSFGGDMFHALYLPYVDLWRGDRRFSALLKQALPSYGNRVVSSLNHLPDKIDNLRLQR